MRHSRVVTYTSVTVVLIPIFGLSVGVVLALKLYNILRIMYSFEMHSGRTAGSACAPV